MVLTIAKADKHTPNVIAESKIILACFSLTNLSNRIQIKLPITAPSVLLIISMYVKPPTHVIN